MELGGRARLDSPKRSFAALDAALPDERRFVIKLIRARLSLGRAQQYSAVAQWQSIRLLTEGL